MTDAIDEADEPGGDWPRAAPTPAARPDPLATLTDLSGHPISVHAAPAWAAVPGVYVVARDKTGREYRPALLGVEGARAVRDALTQWLESGGEEAGS